MLTAWIRIRIQGPFGSGLKFSAGSGFNEYESETLATGAPVGASGVGSRGGGQKKPRPRSCTERTAPSSNLSFVSRTNSASGPVRRKIILNLPYCLKDYYFLLSGNEGKLKLQILLKIIYVPDPVSRVDKGSEYQ